MHVGRRDVVDGRRDEFDEAVDELRRDLGGAPSISRRGKRIVLETYRWGTTVEVVQVLVEGVAVELDRNDLLRR